MLTNSDVEKLIEVFATRDEVKEILATLSTKDDFSKLLTSVDIYAGKADKYFQEMLLLANKVDRHEKWLHQIAGKLGVKLEY